MLKFTTKLVSESKEMGKSAILFENTKKILAVAKQLKITRIWFYKPSHEDWTEDDPVYTMVEIDQKPDGIDESARAHSIALFKGVLEKILGFGLKVSLKDNLDAWISKSSSKIKDLFQREWASAIAIEELSDQEPLIEQFNKKLERSDVLIHEETPLPSLALIEKKAENLQLSKREVEGDKTGFHENSSKDRIEIEEEASPKPRKLIKTSPSPNSRD